MDVGILRIHLGFSFIRKLQVEADEKLQNVYQQLLQAGVEKHENEKEAKLKETLASLQRLFPGTRLYHTFIPRFLH